MIRDVSHCGFLAMLQFIYTNDFDESVSPLHMVELIRSLCLFFSINILMSCSAIAWQKWQSKIKPEINKGSKSFIKMEKRR